MYNFSLVLKIHQGCAQMMPHTPRRLVLHHGSRRFASQGKVRSKAEKKAKTQIERNTVEKLMFGGVVETAAEKRKRIQKEKKEGPTVEKVRVPDSEAYWLANLDCKNVKLFRKTPTGRYKEVQTEKLISALGLIPKQDVCDTIAPKNEATEQRPSPALPEILIRNITSFPLFPSVADNDEQGVPTQRSPTALPSVTHILNQTMSQASKDALERWKQDLIAELGEVGFQKHQRALLDQGASFHACVRRYLETNEPASVQPSLEGCWKSIQPVLDRVTEIQALETRVSHATLLYKGVVDCIASYKGRPSVIEWKKSDKPKLTVASTYDAPLQLCAYLGALSPSPGPRIEHGVVVVAYTDGSPASVFPMDQKLCLYYWGCWLARLQTYWQASAQ